MGYAFGSIDEMGDGVFRKVRRELGVTAFGVNGIVMPPSFEGFLHFHERQDELYFVHRGRALVEIGGETREVGEGGLIHVEATTARRVSNASDSEDLVLLVIGEFVTSAFQVDSQMAVEEGQTVNFVESPRELPISSTPQSVCGATSA